jgi:hypothetical protein
MPYVRWIGQKQPLDVDAPKVRQMIAAGQVTKEDYWAHIAKLTRAIPHRTARLLGQNEGLSKSYLWGPEPQAFVQLVTDADWRRIQSLKEAKQFVLVDGLDPERITGDATATRTL